MRRLSPVVAVCLAVLSACAATNPPAQDPAAGDSYALPVRLPDLTTFALVRTDGGKSAPRVVSVAEAARVLAEYDVIFIGEAHRHAGSHLAEMELFRAIHERAPALSLSMEQFERDVQSVVDDYLADKIGEVAFAEKARAWQGYSMSYRPIVEYAKDHKLPVIAANAPEKAVFCIGREGLAFLGRMKPAERPWVAAKVDDGPSAYRDKYMGFAMADPAHGADAPGTPSSGPPKGPSETAIRGFQAQVARDDTMAESIFLHLQKNPGRKVVHLTGSFHSDGFLGTVARLRARDPKLRIAVVSPDEQPGADGIALKKTDAGDGTFILMIRALPEPYATDDELKAAMKAEVENTKAATCEM